VATHARRFTANWCRRFRREAAPYLRHLKDTPARFLEIGVFEGRTACWLLGNLLTHPGARYVGVDGWCGGVAIERRSAEEVEQRCRANLRPFADRATLIKGRTSKVLGRVVKRHGPFDAVYIDGGHKPVTMLQDTLLVWPAVEPGGIVIWDDIRRQGREWNPLGRALRALLPVLPHELLSWGKQQVVVKKT
jgi:predicted O-methyltransferase YrrM